MTEDVTQTANGDGNTQIVIKEFHANIANISSILAAAIPKVAVMVQNQPDGENDTIAYEIEDKINYNKISSFKEILNEYAQYGTKIDEIYEEYDNQHPGFKKMVFKYFGTKYLLIKESLVSLSGGKLPLDVVTANADKIMRDVFEGLKSELKASKNLAINKPKRDN